MVQPFCIGQVPVDRFGQPLFKCYRWLPAQRFVDLAGIDGITPVVTGTVFDISNELLTGSGTAAQLFIHQLTQQFHQVDVFPFIESADIIGLTGYTFVKHCIDGRCMVFHIKPVARILTITINR